MGRKNKGITIIALIITIIVLLIFAGVGISMLMGDSGILRQVQKSKMATELSTYKEELEIYIANKKIENLKFLPETLTAGKTGLSYNTQPSEEKGNIKTIVTSISNEYIEKIEIISGKMLINTKDIEEIKVAQELGIEANPYDITEEGELLSSNGNLLLVDENGTLVIPGSVTKIGEGAFANLEGLQTIIIPGNVKEIGKNAFAYNKTLETVIMKEGVEKISEKAFTECQVLREVQMPETLMQIEKEAFSGDVKLEKINIPSKIKEISQGVFIRCESVDEFILPQALEAIRARAFSGTKFTKITIPESVMVCERSLFDGNENLVYIKVEGKEPKFVYESGIFMPIDKREILFMANTYMKSITTWNIPEGVQTMQIPIDKYKNITKIRIPKSLTNLSLPRELPETLMEIEVDEENPVFAVDEGKEILYRKNYKDIYLCCSKDETINIQNMDIKSIGDSAFYPATKAKTIFLPDACVEIRDFVFQNCRNLEDLYIGKSVSKIYSLFNYRNFGVTIHIDNLNDFYTIENNVLYNKETTELVTVLYEIKDTFKVKDTVEIIGPSAFHGQALLKDINLGNKIRILGNSFNHCSNLTRIDIPKSIENIGNDCFANIPNLNEIIVHKKENTISGAPWGAIKGMKVVKWLE